MIRKYVTRSIPVAKIHAYSVTSADGKPVVTELDPVEAYGNPTVDEAAKAVKAVYGDDIVVTIAKIEKEVQFFRCPVAKFVSVAERVENSTENQTEETEE